MHYAASAGCFSCQRALTANPYYYQNLDPVSSSFSRRIDSRFSVQSVASTNTCERPLFRCVICAPGFVLDRRESVWSIRQPGFRRFCCAALPHPSRRRYPQPALHLRDAESVPRPRAHFRRIPRRRCNALHGSKQVSSGRKPGRAWWESCIDIQ